MSVEMSFDQAQALGRFAEAVQRIHPDARRCWLSVDDEGLDDDYVGVAVIVNGSGTVEYLGPSGSWYDEDDEPQSWEIVGGTIVWSPA